MLPTTGPIALFAARSAVLDAGQLVAELPGVAVLIRLDERGGPDEATPWAFRPDPLVTGAAHAAGEHPLADALDSLDDSVDDSLDGAPVTTEVGLTPRRAVVSASDETAAPTQMHLSLPAARGQATVHVIPAGDRVVIGRGHGADIRVTERSVSKTHATLQLLVQPPIVRCNITDAGARNGVAVNLARLHAGEKRTLRPGDIVELADVTFLFLDAATFVDKLPLLAGGPP